MRSLSSMEYTTPDRATTVPLRRKLAVTSSTEEVKVTDKAILLHHGMNPHGMSRMPTTGMNPAKVSRPAVTGPNLKPIVPTPFSTGVGRKDITNVMILMTKKHRKSKDYPPSLPNTSRVMTSTGTIKTSKTHGQKPCSMPRQLSSQ